MSMIRITKEFRYEGAHALVGYDRKCKHIHGHSYILYVCVQGKPCEDITSPKYGMIIDFSDLKRIVNEAVIDRFDHALVLREDAPLAEELQAAYRNVIKTPFQPTSENMICYFAQEISRRLPENVKLYSLKYHETASSFVEWFADDNIE